MYNYKYIIQIIFTSTLIYSQFTISGVVVESGSGKPMEAANVFLSETTYGSTTDKHGNFILNNIVDGKYSIVVSVIGYETAVIQFRTLIKKDIEFNFELKQKPLEMSEINVIAQDMIKRNKNLNIFKRVFLGNTRNSLQTRILNTDILDFENRKNILTTSATEPLIIENQALGYKIRYYLEYFEAGLGYVKFSGNSQFIEMVSADTNEIYRWKKNRIKAYGGSLKEFITIISREYLLDVEKYVNLNLSRKSFTGTAELKGVKNIKIFDDLPYKIYFSNKIEEIENGSYHRKNINIINYLSLSERKNELVLKFKNLMVLVYKEEVESLAYLRDFHEERLPGAQLSWITLTGDSVIIDTRGRYQDPLYELQVGGYMAWERLGDMLPADYIPVE